MRHTGESRKVARFSVEANSVFHYVRALERWRQNLVIFQGPRELNVSNNKLKCSAVRDDYQWCSHCSCDKHIHLSKSQWNCERMRLVTNSQSVAVFSSDVWARKGVISIFRTKGKFYCSTFYYLEAVIYQTNYENSSKQLGADFKPYLLQLLLLYFFVAVNYSGDK